MGYHVDPAIERLLQHGAKKKHQRVHRLVLGSAGEFAGDGEVGSVAGARLEVRLAAARDSSSFMASHFSPTPVSNRNVITHAIVSS